MSLDFEHIALVTPTVPSLQRNGGEVVSARVIECLSTIAPVRLFALVRPGVSEVEQQISAVRSICDGVHLFPWHRGRSPVTLIGSWFAGLPLSAYRNACSELRDALREFCQRCPRAVLISDHWLSADAVLRSRSNEQPIILHAHNAEYVMWQRYQARNRITQQMIRHEALRVQRYERQLLLAFNRVVTLSALDAQRLGQLEPALPANRLHSICPTVDLLSGPTSWSQTRPQLLFVGTLSWPPNIRGLDWFVTHVWPVLFGTIPGIRLIVVGGGLPQPVRRRFEQVEGVEIKGFVKDTNPLFRSSRAFVAPVIGGSGVKIKILEAMARGLPTVTTSDGIEGIDVSATILPACNDGKQFLAALQAIWNNPVAWQRRANRSRKEIGTNYSRARAMDAWRRLLHGICSERETPPLSRCLKRRRDISRRCE